MSGITERVKVEEDTFLNRKGTKLHTRTWKPNSEVRGLVFLSHGFGEHLSWYDGLAQRLVTEGLLVFGHDHMGHGKSEGPRAFVESVDQYVQDVFLHCAEVKSHHPGVGLYIYGHSMGGMVALSAVIKNGGFFKGLVLEGALIIPDPAEVTPLRVILGKVMSNILPDLQLGRVSVEQVTSDKEVQVRLTNDKLRWTGGCKLGLGMAFLRCLEDIHQTMSTISLPILIMHGENDCLCQPAGSHLLAKEVKSKDKQLKIYQLASHHLILDVKPVRDEVILNVLNWISDRCPEKSQDKSKLTSL